MMWYPAIFRIMDPPNNIPIAKSIYLNAKLNVDFPSISFERPSYALKVILMDL